MSQNDEGRLFVREIHGAKKKVEGRNRWERSYKMGTRVIASMM